MPGHLLLRSRLLGFVLLFLFCTSLNAVEIVMDADTGEVLTLKGNKSGEAFPVGSVIKVFSALYGLKTKTLKPSDIVNCNGTININGERFQCWDKRGHGRVNLYKALAYSCNVYFCHYGTQIDALGYLRFLKEFGFGRLTGLKCGDESTGKVPEYLAVNDSVKIFSGVGRQFMATPVQVIKAFSAVVNGGKRVQPFFKGSSTGTAVIEADLNLSLYLPHIYRGLREASTYGTSEGYYSQTGGYAKTGTAPWLNGFRTHGWFVGFLPVPFFSPVPKSPKSSTKSSEFPFSGNSNRNRRLVLLVFKRDGTGGKDALPVGMKLAAQLKAEAVDSQPVSVSLFSLLKPKRLSVNGRFSHLTVSAGAGEEVETIRCRKLEVRYGSDVGLTFTADGTVTSRANKIRIQTGNKNGFMRINVMGSGSVITKSYDGSIIIRGSGNRLEVINTVPLGIYLEGVIGNEMGYGVAYGKGRVKGKLSEALKSQAVVSRTYAIKNLKRHATFDFCDTTHCQHYTGKTEDSESIRRAVSETMGLVLTYESQLCDVYFHSTCGGRTSAYQGVWNDRSIPYLVSVDDNARCSPSPHYRWEFRMNETELFQRLKKDFGRVPVNLKITETGKNGWVKRIEFGFVDGSKKSLRGEAFHILMGRRFGWNTIKSAHFIIEDDPSRNAGYIIFRGKGLGHGVGMCQWGARSLSMKGISFSRILNHYFPGCRIDIH